MKTSSASACTTSISALNSSTRCSMRSDAPCSRSESDFTESLTRCTSVRRAAVMNSTLATISLPRSASGSSLFMSRPESP
jgi:hypothetical protein